MHKLQHEQFALSPETIQSIKECADLKTIMDYYGVTYSENAGGGYRGACPIHKGKNRTSFSFDTDKKVYYCFSCGATGDVISFVKEMEHGDFKEAIKKIIEIMGLDERQFNESFIFKAKTNSFFQLNSELYNKMEEKLRKREVAANYIRDESELDDYIELPCCSPESRRFISYELQEDFNIRLGRLPDDPFRHIRIIIPMHDESGNYIGVCGRSWNKNLSPKYWYSPKGVNKKLFVFNLHRAKQYSKSENGISTLYICEGSFDVFSLVDVGIENSVAILGSEPSEEQVYLLTNVAERLVLCLDNDDAGIKGTKKMIALLKELNTHVDIYVCNIPNGKKDIGALDEFEIQDAITELLTAQEWLALQRKLKN